MVKFFEPKGKVQKNREVIRETDARMAKYSRRGLITNFLVYLLCLVDGQFVQTHQKLAIVLTIGLLLTTIVRGYFLFRFEAIYPHGPARWRDSYFYATLAGAFWWGLIMSSITLVLDLKHEAPLLWLYTVVFFSTTAHAFAPYEKFLSVYQFIGLVPASVCSFFIGDFSGVIYGAVLLLFFWILNHQCHLMADNYWTRLEANYILARKTESLEEEKRDTRASVKLSKDYVMLLKTELSQLLEARRGDRRRARQAEEPPKSTEAMDGQASASVESKKGRHTLTRPKLQLLYDNVSDFQQVLSKELELHSGIFNVRQLIQSIIAVHVAKAEETQVELISVMSQALPLRLMGDAERLSQMLHIILTSVTKQAKEETLFIDIEFIRLVEDAGELVVNIYRHKTGGKKLFFQDQEDTSFSLDLGLALGVGIADAMGGSLELSDGDNNAAQLRFSANFTVPQACGQIDFFDNAFRHRNLLLVDDNARVLDIKRQELSMLGLNIHVESDFKQAMVLLEESLSTSKPFHYIAYRISGDHDPALEFAKSLKQHKDLKLLTQFLVSSEDVRKLKPVRALLNRNNIHWIEKPLGVFEFSMLMHSLMNNEKGSDDPDARGLNHSAALNVLFSGQDSIHDVQSLLERFDVNIIQADTLKTIQAALSSRETKSRPDVVVIVVRDDGSHIEMIQNVRKVQAETHAEFVLPVIVVGDAGDDVKAYEQGADQFLLYSSPSRLYEESLYFWARVKGNNEAE